MKQEKVCFSTSTGKRVGIIHHPDYPSLKCVIACHGLFSNKESDKFVTMGEKFANGGVTFFRFDFRGCGESDGNIEDTTISGRREDLLAALSFVRNHAPSPVQTIGLLGSSMGGYIALVVAASDTRVSAVVAWATPFSFEGLKEMLAHTNSPRLNEDFYQDARSYDACQFVPLVQNLLLIHGDGDETVPLNHAEMLYQSARKPKELWVVRGADHTFSDPALRQEAIDHSLTWFTHYLSP